MSYEMTMSAGRARGGGLRVRIAILVAFVLARLSPARLRRVMTWLSRGAQPAGTADAVRAHAAVVATSRRCAGWYGCLPRSIAIAVTCRLRGNWPDWCVGLRAAPPFSAHAWVEAEGTLVGEKGRPADYRRLMVVTVRDVTEGSERGGAARRGPTGADDG